MKKTLIFLILAVMLLPSHVSADMGPKPTVKIDVNGIQEKAYMTLLSKEKQSGPFGVYETQNDDSRYFGDYGPQEVWQAFVDYKDVDGFYFLQYFQLCVDYFQWTYYPPDEFKVLIYFPQSDTFIVSKEIYQRYAFNSFYTVTLNSQNLNVESHSISTPEITVEANYIWNEAMFEFVMRMLITIIIELLVAVIMKFRTQKEILCIIGANILTQIILNLLLEMSRAYIIGIFALCFYLIYETLVILIEKYIYKKVLISHKKNDILTYTIVANIFSFFFGWVFI